MKVLRVRGRSGEKLGHITGKDREKDSYRGEENRSNTSSHAKCRGPITFYQSRAFFFLLGLELMKTCSSVKGAI